MARSRDEIRARKKLRRRWCDVVLDQEWAEQVAETAAEINDLEQRRNMILGADDLDEERQAEMLTDVVAELGAANERMTELEAGKAEAVERFEFKGLSDNRYDAIVSSCPPTKEQRTDAAKIGMPLFWNRTTFRPRLLAATCVSHEWSIEDWADLWDDPEWNTADVQLLFSTAMSACMEHPTVE